MSVEQSTPKVFISHASEDKTDLARPLADMLQAKGYKVWYDEYTLTLSAGSRSGVRHLSQQRPERDQCK